MADQVTAYAGRSFAVPANGKLIMVDGSPFVTDSPVTLLSVVSYPGFGIQCVENSANPVYCDLPPWHGTGTLSAPSSPYIVTYGGVPVGVTLDLYEDVTGFYIQSTTSDPTTGAFAFTGLNTALTFSIRARGWGLLTHEKDQILSRLTPG